MKKIIFGIFAHPDDEAFGPSGTLLMETKAGNEVHLITLTNGQAGANPDNVDDLGALREQEWRSAGRLIGATSMHPLGYPDGELCNLTMIEAAKRIEIIIKDTVEADDDCTIEFMSIDLNGITGHIDHIVAARAACLAFYRLKAVDRRVSRIRLICVPTSWLPTIDTSWIYTEVGRKRDEIDEIIDATVYRDEIIAIMRCHSSQRTDIDHHLNARNEEIGMNYFIVKT